MPGDFYPEEEELFEDCAGATESKLLHVWAHWMVRTIFPIVKEGVFINESLNHLLKFLLLRSNQITSLTDGTTEYYWKILKDLPKDP